MWQYLMKPFAALMARGFEGLREPLAEKGIDLGTGYNPVLDPEAWTPHSDTMDEWRAEHQDDKS